jgi:hypothetical protein
MKDKFLNGLNTFLMIDAFVVLLAFLWFAIAVIGQSFNLSLGLNLWYNLWQPIFNPAIGLLMLGAIASGIASWLKRKFASSQLK